jgi:hypothetical protein
MNVNKPMARAKPVPPTREEIADLLHQYPNLSAGEVTRMLAFLRKGRQLDVGMLTADERLQPHLDRFMSDHAKHFRVGIAETSAVVAAIMALLALCWSVWEVVKPISLAA